MVVASAPNDCRSETIASTCDCVKAAAEAAAARGYPEWVEVDAKALKGTYKAAPQRSELPSTINESLVVELYSK